MRSRVADFQRQAAPEVQARDEAWFYAQLQRVRPEVYQKGKDFMILCPYHADNDPSCGVDRHTGVFNCWSCKAGGWWNELAEKLGMEKLHYKHDKKREKALDVKTMVAEAVHALDRLGVKQRRNEGKDISRPLVSPWVAKRGWRKVTGALLTKIGAVQVVDLANNVERIGLPVRTPDNAILGYTCRALDPEDSEPKYTPLSADRIEWRNKELPASTALFLIERVFIDGWTRIVLVEGPYDALRLYQAGVPAVAILGTSNWTPIKCATICGLGLQAAGVMLDSDTSGREMQPVVLEDLLRSIRAIGLNLPTGIKDPGDLSDKQAAWVGNRLSSI